MRLAMRLKDFHTVIQRSLSSYLMCRRLRLLVLRRMRDASELETNRKCDAQTVFGCHRVGVARGASKIRQNNDDPFREKNRIVRGAGCEAAGC